MNIVKLEIDDIKKTAQKLASISPWRTLGYQQKTLENYLHSSSEGTIHYKILHSNVMAGVLCIKQPWWKGCYIEILAIFPEFQKRGLGIQTLQWVEKESKKAGMKNIWLLVSDFNCSAYKFYKSNGFTKVGKLDALITENHAELLMRKQI